MKATESFAYRWWTCVGATVVLGAVLTAQEPSVFRSTVTAISIDVSVKAGSKPLHGLTKEDFVLYEETQPQEIVHFAGSPESIKLLALGVLDARYSDLLAGKFFRIMPMRPGTPRDPRTNDKTYADLRAAVESMRAVPGRRGIVVLDPTPLQPDTERDPVFEELLQIVRQGGIPIYRTESFRENPGAARAAARLRVLIEQSGGGVIPVSYPRRGPFRSTPILTDAAVSFIQELASTNYTLAYQSVAPADGKARRITIRLSNERIKLLKDPKVTIWQSRGDYSPSPDTPELLPP